MGVIVPIPIASGWLPSGAANGEKAQFTTNSTGVRSATVGSWTVVINGLQFDRRKHHVVANIIGIATTDPLQTLVGLGNIGSDAGFTVSANRNTGGGFAAADLELVYAVFLRPEVA